jgi:CDP-6-deoxy-D-xylo-4-hexulose-3-dehydrase
MLRQPAFQGVVHRQAAPLERTEKIMRDTFLVGVYPGLSDDMIDYMAECIASCVHRCLDQKE